MALKIVSGLDVTSVSLSSFLDLAKNEIRNAQIHNLTTTEINGISSPVSGQFAFDTTLNKLKVYTGSAWELVGAAADDTTIELTSNTLSLKALSVATGFIANLAVTSGKLADGAVGTAKLATDAVTTAKIADAQITTDLIATDAVTAAKIADNSIDIARLNVSDGSAGQFLKTDGSGTLSFATQSDEDVAAINLVKRLDELDTTHTQSYDSTNVVTIGASSSTPDVQITGDLTVDGDLTVGGTTTTVNSTTVTIDDPVFTLGGDSAPATDDNKDRGIEFNYHNGTSAKLGFFGWDDSERVFTAFSDATNTSEVFSGTLAAAKFATITAGTIDATANFILGGAYVTSTAAELNILDGVTATAAELNILDGVTATAAELNHVDGVTSAIQTQLDSKPKAYSADVTTSSGTATIAHSAHGISFPANVQLYDENGQLVLADVRQTVDANEMTITINAPDATYSVIAVGAPAS